MARRTTNASQDAFRTVIERTQLDGTKTYEHYGPYTREATAKAIRTNKATGWRVTGSWIEALEGPWKRLES